MHTNVMRLNERDGALRNILEYTMTVMTVFREYAN